MSALVLADILKVSGFALKTEYGDQFLPVKLTRQHQAGSTSKQDLKNDAARTRVEISMGGRGRSDH
jgi:hypothetical protein